jgi:hypothetical protein
VTPVAPVAPRTWHATGPKNSRWAGRTTCGTGVGPALVPVVVVPLAVVEVLVLVVAEGGPLARSAAIRARIAATLALNEAI